MGLWTLRMMMLASDVIREDGTIGPIVAGGIMDQPAKTLAALRIIRGERARLAAEDRRRRENEARVQRGR